VPQDTLRYAAHASPHFDDELPASERVVNVEPWAWNSAPRVARRILIADDNKTNRLILQQILESAGYQVEAVDNGDDALVCLSSGTFKAAVLDMHMPGIDGVQLLRQYKRMAGGRTIPLIMLTADVTFDAKRDCAEAGADAFLTKPARSDALLSMLEGLIHDSEVHVLPTSITTQRHDREEAVTDEQAVLDLSVLGELDRVCRDPVRLSEVVETFASEGVVLLERIRAAAGGRNHSGYAEWVHALKGNAANVGAVRLAEACRRAGAVDLIGFHREGIGTSDELGASFDEALHALRDLIPPVTSPGRSGPV
jgi:two-component system sensor histidine kinase RpfC